MFRLRLPIWVVSERHRKNSLPETPCEEASAAPAFTTAERITEFLATGKAGRWKVELVSDREELILAMADLHQDGAIGICVDANPDGSGGDLVTLEALARFCAELSG